MPSQFERLRQIASDWLEQKRLNDLEKAEAIVKEERSHMVWLRDEILSKRTSAEGQSHLDWLNEQIEGKNAKIKKLQVEAQVKPQQ